jgi:hypothetical protein
VSTPSRVTVVVNIVADGEDRDLVRAPPETRRILHPRTGLITEEMFESRASHDGLKSEVNRALARLAMPIRSRTPSSSAVRAFALNVDQDVWTERGVGVLEPPGWTVGTG